MAGTSWKVENKQLRMGVDIAQDQRKLSLRSFMGGYKVMLILAAGTDGCRRRQQALEGAGSPRPSTVFLMVSGDSEALLATILSRAQLVKVPALRPTELAEALNERFPELNADEAMAIALRSEGDLLDAVDMASKGERRLVFFRDWLRSCYKREVDRRGNSRRASRSSVVNGRNH